jgi:glycosyltransferase involved in cell wall biosynthesis
VAAAGPRVSIVTPSFNQAEFLEETLRSILLQDYPALELIVIDGGSRDGSVDIIRRYAPWIKDWVSEPDRGQADAINKGMARATGEIVAWLNSDDVYAPGAIQAAVAALSAQSELGGVYGDVAFTAANGRVLNVMPAWPYDRRQLVCATNLMPQPATFVYRAGWERVGGLDLNLRLALDYDLWVRLALSGVTFAHVPGVWATYRLHEASKTESQGLGFALEMRAVVARAFATGQLPEAWRAEAESNLEQYEAEALDRLGRRAEARRRYWAAVRRAPWRAKAAAQLAYAIDTRLGVWMRGLRWRLAGRREPAWQMPGR